MHTHHESGNVLWMILAAVVLLGALTVALSRSGSSVDQTGDVERLSVQANQIMRYAKSLEAAVQNMKLQGISENEISFANGDSTTTYTNTSCDAAADRNYPYCLIFDDQGAGLNYNPPSASWLDSSHSGETYYGDWLFSGFSCISGIGTGDDSSCDAARDEKELLVILPFITQSLCQRINQMADAPITSGNPPSDDGDAWTDGSAEFTGGFAVTGELIADNPVADIEDVYTGCFEGSGASATPPSGSYHFYHVLLAR